MWFFQVVLLFIFMAKTNRQISQSTWLFWKILLVIWLTHKSFVTWERLRKTLRTCLPHPELSPGIWKMFALEYSRNKKIPEEKWQSLSVRETPLIKVLKKHFSHLFKISVFQNECYNPLVDYETNLLFILFCIFSMLINT